MFRITPVAVLVVGLLSTGGNAKASCGDPAQSSGVGTPTLNLEQSGEKAASLSSSESTQSTDRHSDGSILGLWHVAYVLFDGKPFYQSFKFWHPDGTEWESASVSPLSGNVCLGVWRETKPGNIRLHHVGWSFSGGMLTGTLTLDESNTVAPNGRTYTGTFVFTNYDVNGTFLQQVKGTLTARRISVDSAPSAP
jgi:hypothetical protein